jgi:hypothetical protein
VRLVVAAVLPWTAAACFATRNDVRVLQQDIATARAESARADSARSTQFGALAAQLGAVNDSIRTLSTRALSFQGDARDDLRWLREQIIQVQELTGQSQRVIQQLRGSLEGRTAEMAAAAGRARRQRRAGSEPAVSARARAVPARQLPSARQAFTDLLTRFPTADVAAGRHVLRGGELRGREERDRRRQCVSGGRDPVPAVSARGDCALQAGARRQAAGRAGGGQDRCTTSCSAASRSRTRPSSRRSPGARRHGRRPRARAPERRTRRPAAAMTLPEVKSAGEMPFLDHLEELRWRLVWSLAAFCVALVVAFALVSQFDVIKVLETPVLPYLAARSSCSRARAIPSGSCSTRRSHSGSCWPRR